MLCIKLIEISEHSSAFQIWMSLPYRTVRPLLQILGWMWWQRLLHPNEDTLTTYQVNPLLRRLSNKVPWSLEMCASFWFLFVHFLPFKYTHFTFIYRIIYLRLWLLDSRVCISISVYLANGTIGGSNWYICFSQYCSPDFCRTMLPAYSVHLWFQGLYQTI